MRVIWIGLVSVIAAAAVLPIGCGDSPENTSSSSGMGGNTSTASSTSSSSSSGKGGASSSSSSSSSTGMGGAASSSTTSTSIASTAASTAASSAASSSSGGLDGGMLINGCDAATAEDHTGMATATITFPVGGFAYSPKCIKVSNKTNVIFNGNFAFHPLVAGEVVGGVAVPAAPGTSPLPTNAGGLNTGMTATFTMQPVGVYPYYCNVHALFGMTGAIFVVP